MVQAIPQFHHSLLAQVATAHFLNLEQLKKICSHWRLLQIANTASGCIAIFQYACFAVIVLTIFATPQRPHLYFKCSKKTVPSKKIVGFNRLGPDLSIFLSTLSLGTVAITGTHNFRDDAKKLAVWSEKTAFYCSEYK